MDLTLADARGNHLPMPSDFDAFGPEAAMDYIGDNPQIRKNLATLQYAMRRAGFVGYRREWWHFEDHDYLPLKAEDSLFASQIGLNLPLPPDLCNRARGWED